jgi:hypothetical protein
MQTLIIWPLAEEIIPTVGSSCDQPIKRYLQPIKVSKDFSISQAQQAKRCVQRLRWNYHSTTVGRIDGGRSQRSSVEGEQAGNVPLTPGGFWHDRYTILFKAQRILVGEGTTKDGPARRSPVIGILGRIA